jgi:hypothetical protein
MRPCDAQKIPTALFNEQLVVAFSKIDYREDGRSRVAEGE